MSADSEVAREGTNQPTSQRADEPCSDGCNRPYFAHSLSPPHTVEEWEPLYRHLTEVSRIAAEFAGAFGAAGWGQLLGRWHDLGKYSGAFQQYLLSSADSQDAGEECAAPGRVDHSTFGARHAARAVGGHKGMLLAFCIAGHHAGLPNALPTDSGDERSSLKFRLSEQDRHIPRVDLPAEEETPPKLTLPFTPSGPSSSFQVAFFTRMLFSVLVDADRLATEAFCDPTQAAYRSLKKPSVGDLLATLEGYLRDKQAAAPQTTVNALRGRILADCGKKASLPPGFFSLNVPTGGGKTLSSLAFGLRHALTHNLRRVIIAAPFTTIIEQTADEYRRALGSLAQSGLIEHHSNITPEKDTRQNKLAAENWDVPLIVTTNVQLYESLFASAATPCRKLHRLARSVIILDEAQTIPVELLHPTLLALRELVDHYSCTVVLCTATLPALESREDFQIGIPRVAEIVPDGRQFYADLRRVQTTRLGKLTDEDLADRLAHESSVLCIVNTRAHAAKLYDALAGLCDPTTCFHLSTLMCAQHRREVLAVIRQRLKDGSSCRLVSTQLIEAGVDIDFPAVYRAPAGFDSIAQAAGRCNREGHLPAGKFCLFDTETQPPAGLLRHAAQAASELTERFDDPLMPEAVEAYFRLFYWSQQHLWDRRQVLESFDADLRDRRLLHLQFRTAAFKYRIIADEQAPVLVPFDEDARKMRDELLRGKPAHLEALRSAQKYVVGVWKHRLAELTQRSVVIPHVESGLWILVNESAYTPRKGLSLETSGMDPGILIR